MWGISPGVRYRPRNLRQIFKPYQKDKRERDPTKKPDTSFKDTLQIALKNPLLNDQMNLIEMAIIVKITTKGDPKPHFHNIA